MNAGAIPNDLPTLGAPDLRPRDADGWGPGMAMAAGAHILLVIALALGVHWKIANPPPMEAEVWAEIPKAAAPEPVAPPPEPTPPPPIEKVAPPEPEVEQPAPEPVPDIVVRKEVKKKEPKKRKEPVEIFETTPPKVAKAEPKPKPEKKPEPPKPAVTKEVKVDNSKAVAERESHRNAQLQRMMNQLGSMGASPDGGSQSAGPSASYAGRIKSRVKPRIVFTDTVNGNPEAVVEVRCAPDGRIISSKLIQQSGIKAWDEAVQRAVDRTEILPMDESGKVPPVIQISFRPNDL